MLVPVSRQWCRADFYQRSDGNAMTPAQAQRSASNEVNTPARSLFQPTAGQLQAARHSHPAISAITSPNSSSTADQTSADEKFAI